MQWRIQAGSHNHADGQVVVLVRGHEVWGEWTSQAVEDIDWRK